MRRSLLSILMLLVSSITGAVTVVDDEGNQLNFDEPVSRLITLSPSLTEMVYSIDAQDRLIATVQYSDYPEAAKSKPRIGNYERFVMERVIAFKPDLVVAWASANNAQQLEQLEKMNIRVYRSEPRLLSDISKTLRNLGILTGHQQQAERLADEFDRRLAKLQEQNRKKIQLKGFYQVWHQPVYTVNGEHIISKIMALWGINNIFSRAAILAPKVTVEAVIKHNPDLIIASGMASAQPEWLNQWRTWPAIKAVKMNNLFFIDPDLIQRQSVRLLDATEIMCQQADEARTKLAN